MAVPCPEIHSRRVGGRFLRAQANRHGPVDLEIAGELVRNCSGQDISMPRFCLVALSPKLAVEPDDGLARRPRRHGGRTARRPHASPKGLRRGFGVAAVSAGIPLNLVQKWLGHAQLTTTAIYANAVGAEGKDIASRIWG